MTIEVKIIADSISANKVRITTWELTYPRIIHSELMTHRMFSRNSASSRAIPIEKMLETIQADPAMPVHWGKNQAGMQAKEELEPVVKTKVKELWLGAVICAINFSREMAAFGAHKQIANRVTEFAQHMKIVMTSTEMNNWWWLRDHPDADPTIHALARKMKQAYDSNTPQTLRVGQWHMPFVATYYDDKHNQLFVDENGQSITTDQALMISASCCAQVSYRRSDGSLEKAETIFKRLVESEPCHASPVEHQAQAFHMPDSYDEYNVLNWPKGVTHIDRKGWLWSGNFRGWVQYRQLIPNNAKYG